MKSLDREKEKNILRKCTVRLNNYFFIAAFLVQFRHRLRKVNIMIIDTNGSVQFIHLLCHKPTGPGNVEGMYINLYSNCYAQ
jgi:hypothetical protein